MQTYSICVRTERVIIITHKVLDAIKVADRFMFLKEGSIIFDGSRDKLLHSTGQIQDVHKRVKCKNMLNHIGGRNV